MSPVISRRRCSLARRHTRSAVPRIAHRISASRQVLIARTSRSVGLHTHTHTHVVGTRTADEGSMARGSPPVAVPLRHGPRPRDHHGRSCSARSDHPRLAASARAPPLAQRARFSSRAFTLNGVAYPSSASDTCVGERARAPGRRKTQGMSEFGVASKKGRCEFHSSQSLVFPVSNVVLLPM